MNINIYQDEDRPSRHERLFLIIIPIASAYSALGIIVEYQYKIAVALV